MVGDGKLLAERTSSPVEAKTAVQDGLFPYNNDFIYYYSDIGGLRAFVTIYFSYSSTLDFS